MKAGLRNLRNIHPVKYKRFAVDATMTDILRNEVFWREEFDDDEQVVILLLTSFVPLPIMFAHAGGPATFANIQEVQASLYEKLEGTFKWEYKRLTCSALNGTAFLFHGIPTQITSYQRDSSPIWNFCVSLWEAMLLSTDTLSVTWYKGMAHLPYTKGGINKWWQMVT